MRLKGGKLLIYFKTSPISLSDDEINCILTKGLTIQSPYLIPHSVVTIDINFDNLVADENDFVYGLSKTLTFNGDEFATFLLDLNRKELQYTEI